MMDCSTARLFLELNGRSGGDLGDDERNDLDSHLEHCTDCNALATQQHRFDQHLGRAMCAVEVPRGLKDQILQRLEAQKSERFRRWAMRSLRVFSAAAAILLLVWGWFAFYPRAKPEIAAGDVCDHFNLASRDRAAVTDQLSKLGMRVKAPNFVNYAYLHCAPVLTVLPSSLQDKPIKVPMLVFSNEQSGRSRPRQEAFIYILSRRKYEVVPPETVHDGYKYRIDVYDPDPTLDNVYLILHTGRNWDWLYLPPDGD